MTAYGTAVLYHLNDQSAHSAKTTPGPTSIALRVQLRTLRPWSTNPIVADGVPYVRGLPIRLLLINLSIVFHNRELKWTTTVKYKLCSL